MKTPVSTADHTVRVGIANRLDCAPVSQRLARTIGTPTHAMSSDSRESPKWNSSTIIRLWPTKPKKITTLTLIARRAILRASTPTA